MYAKSSNGGDMSKRLIYAELQGQSILGWLSASKREQERLISLPYIEKIVGSRLYFVQDLEYNFNEKSVRSRIGLIIRQVTHSEEILYKWEDEPANDDLIAALRDKKKFQSINFGPDVAEHDADLQHYFLSTSSFRRCLDGSKCIVIGPKGSGKTAILSSLKRRMKGVVVIITPEIFATSVLKQFADKSNGVFDEVEAFTSTWIFTILIEIFKQICERPAGKAKALHRIRAFLRENTTYQDVDIFTRYMLRLKSIEALKLGPYEFGLKTKKLQELYSLEPLYSLVPELRDALHEDVLILIDELDQGWDNSPQSVLFLSALMQAALRVQNLGLKFRVIAFVRSEIFDLLKGDLDQLDKLRSGIEEIKWGRDELAGLIVKRLAFCFKIPTDGVKNSAIGAFLDAPCHGISAFDYILSRTTYRPREVLQFVRQVHQIAVDDDASKIDLMHIKRAETSCSRWKYDHLCSEYKHIYPMLGEVIWKFRCRGPVLTRSEVEDIVASIQYELTNSTKAVSWLQGDTYDIIQSLFNVDFIGVEKPLKKVGVISLMQKFEFAFQIPSSSVRRANSFLIHPAFWSALEIDDIDTIE
jgi:hypothetical protein